MTSITLVLLLLLLIALSLFLSLSVSHARATSTADVHNERGIVAAEDTGDVRAAAEHFRRAIVAWRNEQRGEQRGEQLRAPDPFTVLAWERSASASYRHTAATYWCNLGVARMRADDLVAAQSAFDHALSLDPAHEDTLDNLRTLDRMRGAADVASASSSSTNPTTSLSHKRDKLPRLHLTDFGSPRAPAYAWIDAPFVLLGVADAYLAKHPDAFDVDAIAARFPTSMVDFYPANMADRDVHPYILPMTDALHELRLVADAAAAESASAYPTNARYPGRYIQWNMSPAEWRAFTRDLPLPYQSVQDEAWLQLLPDALVHEFTRKTHWRMLLIGTDAAGMFNHVDSLRTHSWQLQVRGAKRWHLCAPSQSSFVYGAGEVDCFAPDYATHPRMLQAHCYDDVVRTGEMVFYPIDYWHQTRNLGARVDDDDAAEDDASPRSSARVPLSVSLSASIVNLRNYPQVERELDEECTSNKYKWSFSTELCQALRTIVFPHWHDRFDAKRWGEVPAPPA